MAGDLESSRLISPSNFSLEESTSPNYGTIWHDLERRRESHSVICRRNKWITVLFGQLVALIATSQNAASFSLEYGMGKVFPNFLMFPAYLILSLHLFWNRSSSDTETPFKVPFAPVPLRTPWWYYLCLSIVDIAPNYLQLISLQHTSLTSATLLGSLTVPSTMLVCRFLLAKVYQPQHYLGVVLCMIGGILTIWADFDHSTQQLASSLHPHSYYGDLLAVLAALIYGVGDAAGEFWSKHVDRKEYLGMIGLHGSIATLSLTLLYERDEVSNLFSDRSTLLPAMGVILIYIPMLVMYYVSATLFMVASDATLLNLSLQSSNLWAILYSVFAFREAPSLLFYLAVFLVVTGVFVYELFGNASNDQSSKPKLGKKAVLLNTIQ